jgi:hypothetical protein
MEGISEIRQSVAALGPIDLVHYKITQSNTEYSHYKTGYILIGFQRNGQKAIEQAHKGARQNGC